MNKRERFYNKIEEYKQRFRKMSSEAIRDRLRFGFLVKEAAIAYREVLEERNEPIYDYENEFDLKADSEKNDNSKSRILR